MWIKFSGASIALDDAITKLEKEINHTRVNDLLYYVFAEILTMFENRLENICIFLRTISTL